MRILFLAMACMLAFGTAVGADDAKGDPKEQTEGSKSPFLSDQQLLYYSRADGMVGFMRPRWFQGVFIRNETKSTSLNDIEFYRLDREIREKIVVDDGVCASAAKMVLGPLDQKPWAVGKTATYKNRYGTVCEIQVKVTSKIADFKEYRFAAAPIHGTVHLFMAKFERAATDEEVEEFREFVRSLHLDVNARASQDAK